MITAIEIENFKAIRDRVRLDLKPITLLFGPNSSGKSSVIHALHYAREVFGRRNLDADRVISGGDLIDLGGFRNFVHGRDLSRAVVLRFGLDLRRSELPTYNYVVSEGYVGNVIDAIPPDLTETVNSASVEVAVAWSEFRQSCYVQRYAVEINGVPLGSIESTFERRQVALTNVNYEHPVLRGLALGDAFSEILALASERAAAAVRQQTEPMVPIERQVDALPTWGQALPLIFFMDGTPSLASVDPKAGKQAQTALDLLSVVFSQLLVGPGELLRDALQNFRHLGPLRETPPRNYAPPRFRDLSRWVNGAAAWDLLHADAALARSTSQWLSGKDGLAAGYTVRLKEYKELALNSPLMVLLRSERAFDDLEDVRRMLDGLPTRSALTLVEDNTGVELQPHDVGVGISQLIPVVVLAVSRHDTLDIIEQPELHVHPRIQVRLGDMFIRQAGADPSGRFLLETHSEHLLLRLLRRIRETAEGDLPPGYPGLKPEQVAVIYVEPGGEEGPDGKPAPLRLRPLKIDDTGEFMDRWPRGFFEERAEELF